ncbi:MAG: hypothetical protein FJW64_02335 [Actinobacteria bacterium]|nr:hypothetical protein [Actinomycetota bacterium]
MTDAPDEDIEGGPGWIIGGDLRPRITDVAAFRAGMAEDPLASVIEALWTGDWRYALDVLRSLESSLRVRALTADCLAASGDTASALQIYDALVTETTGTPREATMRQHRGKVLLAAGRTDAAIADFAAALALRADADAKLRASSAHALRVARRKGCRRAAPRNGEKRPLH